MEETQDQVSEETQETEQPSEQSETTSKEEVKTYKLNTVEGEKEFSDIESLYEYTQKINPGFTRVSQENARLREQVAAAEAKSQAETAEALSASELLKDVDPNVAEAIKQIVSPVIQDALKSKDAETARDVANKEFDRKLDELEKKYTGGDGLPKFNRDAIIVAMREPGNEIFDPEIKFQTMNREAFNDYLVKQALKAQAGEGKTESTTGSTPKKPTGKPAKDFNEASDRVYKRLISS
jgi:predicted RNA-binding Zn ribbon-like protein